MSSSGSRVMESPHGRCLGAAAEGEATHGRWLAGAQHAQLLAREPPVQKFPRLGWVTVTRGLWDL